MLTFSELIDGTRKNNAKINQRWESSSSVFGTNMCTARMQDSQGRTGHRFKHAPVV